MSSPTGLKNHGPNGNQDMTMIMLLICIILPHSELLMNTTMSLLSGLHRTTKIRNMTRKILTTRKMLHIFCMRPLIPCKTCMTHCSHMVLSLARGFMTAFTYAPGLSIICIHISASSHGLLRLINIGDVGTMTLSAPGEIELLLLKL